METQAVQGTMNSRVRRSAEPRAPAPARHMRPESNELAGRRQQQHYAQKQCLGDISHELRAPISRVRVLLERARGTPQEVWSYLARIEDNVLRMEALTGRLLDFSRLEFGSIKATNRLAGKGLQVTIQIPLPNKSH